MSGTLCPLSVVNVMTITLDVLTHSSRSLFCWKSIFDVLKCKTDFWAVLDPGNGREDETLRMYAAVKHNMKMVSTLSASKPGKTLITNMAF